MKDNSEKGENRLKDKGIIKIIDHKKTQQRLKTHLNIIKKVIYSLVWINKTRFPEDLFYEIQKFVFRNPLCFVAPIYKDVDSHKLKITDKKSYILVNSNLQRNQEIKQQNKQSKNQVFNEKPRFHKISFEIYRKTLNLHSQVKKLESVKSGQYAVNIKVHKRWKNCKINYENSTLRQIITKSKHFIDFLKNVKIDNPKNPVCQNERNFDSQNFEEKEGKLYTLICQNFDYIFSKIVQIQENQKEKRLDDSIAKTYVQMMNKNMIILSVQKNNFNHISYKSEGKFLYIQNNSKLPLFSRRFERIYGHLESFKIQSCLLKLIPHLQCNNDQQWTLKNVIEGSLELFEQNGKKIDRGRGMLIDKFMNCFAYDDFQIKEI